MAHRQTSPSRRLSDRRGRRSPRRYQDIDISPGYCAEWHDEKWIRRGLLDTEDLRRKMTIARDRAIFLVVHELGSRVVEILRDIGGVDGSFIEGHIRGRRPKRTGACQTWEYPELTRTFRRVSMWMSPRGMVVLLVDRPVLRTPMMPPRLRHQDAVTKTSGLLRYETSSGLEQQQEEETMSIDAELCECLGGSRPLEDLLGDIVHSRWVDYLERGRRDEPTVLRSALGCLERNQETGRILERAYGRPCGDVTFEDWGSLIDRVYRRLRLAGSKGGAGGGGSEESAGRTPAERRSLDRISYLGGILLPVSVVSSILGLPGPYGPGDSRFWLFWVISLSLCVVVLGIIYLDQVRALQVWIEVAADAMMDLEERDDCWDHDEFVIQDSRGNPVRVWRRRDLGWSGALKKVSGYYSWRGTPAGLLFEMPPRIGR